MREADKEGPVAAELDQHRTEVEQLNTAFGKKENPRVPILFACDEQVWLKVTGRTFGEFYRNPAVHLKVQLEGRKWFIENVIGDMTPCLPDRWQVGVVLWMEENEFFGCDVVYQEHDFAWGVPLPFGREDLLSYIADLNPEDQVRRCASWRMYQALKELCDGLTFADRPVDVLPPGVGTHGIFTKAAEIRGIEQLCLDMVEAPEFAEQFLSLVTRKTLERIQAWHRLVTGQEKELPSPNGFHLPDDSLQIISPETYKRFVLPCHEWLYSQMTTARRTMHLCGYAAQHYPTLFHKLNVTHIDGPGTFVDHGRYLRELGPEFSFVAQTNHSVLATGPESAIETMMRELLTPEAKLPGRLQVVAFAWRDTPLEHLRVCYEAGKRYGAI